MLDERESRSRPSSDPWVPKLERADDDEEDEDGIDNLDFGLPGGVSDYVLSVRFDESGDIDEISMES